MIKRKPGDYGVPLCAAEKYAIVMLREANPEMSYRDIADRLNLLYRDYNSGSRTRAVVIRLLNNRKNRKMIGTFYV